MRVTSPKLTEKSFNLYQGLYAKLCGLILDEEINDHNHLQEIVQDLGISENIPFMFQSIDNEIVNSWCEYESNKYLYRSIVLSIKLILEKSHNCSELYYLWFRRVDFEALQDDEMARYVSQLLDDNSLIFFSGDFVAPQFPVYLFKGHKKQKTIETLEEMEWKTNLVNPGENYKAWDDDGYPIEFKTVFPHQIALRSSLTPNLGDLISSILDWGTNKWSNKKSDTTQISNRPYELLKSIKHQLSKRPIWFRICRLIYRR